MKYKNRIKNFMIRNKEFMLIEVLGIIILLSIDRAGNVSEVSNKYVIKIDKTAPTCTSSGGLESWKNKSNVEYGIILKGTYLSGCINPADIR